MAVVFELDWRQLSNYGLVQTWKTDLKHTN